MKLNKMFNKYFSASRFVIQIFSVCILLSWLSTASAQNPTIAITLIQNLSFGTVPTNTSGMVATSDPGAGNFEAQYYINANKTGTLSLTFALPGNLTSGTHTLPITFGANSAEYNSTNSLSGGTAFNPSQGLSDIPVQPQTPSTMYVWIGGTVSPSIGLAAGTYTGTMTVTATLVVGNKTATSTKVINISVTVIEGLSLSTSGSLDFGMIVAGTNPVQINAQTSLNAPMLTATGNPNSEMTVTYSSTSSLNDGHGNNLTLNSSVYGSSSSMNQSGSSSVLSGARETLTGSLGGTGYYYFWVGGSLNPVPANQPAGNYTGTFTLSVNY